MFDKEDKVLIVDDDENNVLFLEEVLIAEGMEYVSAKDGMEALKAMESHKGIKLILLDRMMPKMSGMDFVEQIRQKKEWKDIPIIMQTARSSVSDVIEGASAGLFYYLTKPYGEEEIVSVLRSAIESINNDT